MPEDQICPQSFQALWQRAIALLQPGPGQAGGASLEDAQQVLHDLQVYHAELERQNEELRRTQLEVETARDRYASLYDCAPAGYFSLDAAGHIREANLKGAALLGAERERLAGQLLSDFVAPGDRDAYHAYIDELFQTREPQACELRMLRRDGSGLYARLEGEASEAEAGRQCHLVMSVIIRRTGLEEALRESEARLRTIYDTAPVSIWQEDWTSVIEAIEEVRARGVTDFPAYFRDHPEFVTHVLQAVQILDVNQWTVDIFGARHKEELLASLDTVFATPDTLPGFVAELTALAQGQEVFRTEMAVNTVQGDTRQILLAMSFPPPGSGSGQVLVSAIDITERKRAEAALRESEERLRQAHEVLEAVTKGTEVIVAAQDTDFRYIFFNEAYREEIKRLAGKDIHVGARMVETFAHMPEQQQIALQQWSRTLQGGSASYRIEFGEPGRYRRVYSVRHTPIRDARGNVVGRRGRI